MKPVITVILPAMHGYDSVRAAIDSWESQTRRADMELMVLCPARPKEILPPGQIVLTCESRMLHEARGDAIRRARGEYVLLAEDHCLPDADCIERMVERLKEGWDAIGPALRPGVPGITSQGSFLISYGQWLMPSSGPAANVPGHNVLLRRQTLLDLGDELDDQLVAGMFLMQTLHRKGKRFFVDEKARMRHFDVPHFRKSLRIFFTVGRGCGAIRTKDSSGIVRSLFVLSAPLVAARHFGRGAIAFARTGLRAGFSPACLVTGGIFACAWAAGESAGAFRRLKSVLPSLWMSESKPPRAGAASWSNS